MKKNLAGTLLTLAILLTLTPHLLQAKGKGANQWFLTPRIGAATMIGEVNSSFTTVDSDFKHGFGLNADLALSRTFGSHFEVGLGVEFYKLSSSDDSLFIEDLRAVATGNLPPSFSNVKRWNKPIEYQTSNLVPNLFFRYYFKRFASRARDAQKFQPYLELNVGFNFHSPELNYIDTTGILIEDGEISNLPSVWYLEQHKNKIPYSSTEQALQFGFGLGTRFTLNQGLTFNLAASVSGTKSEYMDALPNLLEDEVTSTLVAKVVFGVSIPIGSGSGSKRSSGGEHLPWAPN